MQSKVCKACLQEKPITKFRPYCKKVISYSAKCYACMSRESRTTLNPTPRRLPYQVNLEWFKVCSKCKSEKKLTEFAIDKRASFGVQAECKSCARARYRLKKPLKPVIYTDRKTCIKCGEEKLLSAFPVYKKTNGTTGRCAKCSHCKAGRSYKIHKPYLHNEVWVKFCSHCQKVKPLKDFVKRVKGFDRCRICNAKKSSNFAKNASTEQKEKIRENSRKCSSKRRAIVKGAKFVIKFTVTDIIKRDGLNCYLCDKKLTAQSATIEHIIPLSRGGDHKPENVKLACKNCNCSKHSKTLTEYKKYRGDYDELKKRLVKPLLFSRLSV